MAVKLRPNLSALNRKLSAGLEQAAGQFDDQFRGAIEADVYAWPRETVRSNGRTVGSPRDIVDTGKLRDSQQFQVNDLAINFLWDAIDPETGLSYASDVFYGYTNGNGTDFPARDWISYAFSQRPPIETLSEAIRNA